MIPADELADVFVEMADSLVAEFDLVEFLSNLSERAATISGAMAVGVLLADQDGRLRYIAGSTEQAGLVELYEMQQAQGPCFDC
ncbi:MAG: transcriptional regulator, partial [Aeromicrobium sp.]|nr:transcriptional regulator [Aeromicrobium sp.]